MRHFFRFLLLVFFVLCLPVVVILALFAGLRASFEPTAVRTAVVVSQPPRASRPYMDPLPHPSAAKKGVNIEAVSKNAQLIEAARTGQSGTVEDLLRQGANPNTRGPEAATPLHFAAENGHAYTCEKIILAGGDINSVNNQGRTALHIAAERGHTDLVRTLTRYGANITIRDNDGQLPQDLARNSGHEEIVQLLAVQRMPEYSGIMDSRASGRVSWLKIMILPILFLLVFSPILFLVHFLRRRSTGPAMPSSDACIRGILSGLDKMERRVDNLETIIEPLDHEGNPAH